MNWRNLITHYCIRLTLTACKKEQNPAPAETTTIEETTTGITKEQLLTLYENAKSAHEESPELFTEDADISIIDLPEITDADIPVSEAITINETIQILQEDNISNEILDEVAKQIGLIIGEESRWDEVLTKNEALNFILRIYENIDTITNADRGYATGEVIDTSTTEVDAAEGIPFEEGEYSEPPVQENVDTSEVADAIEQAKKDMQEFYEAGLISEEEYKEVMESLEEEPQTGGSIVSEYIPSTSDQAIIQQYEENSKKALEEIETTGQGDQRTNINYDIDLPDEYKGR